MIAQKSDSPTVDRIGENNLPINSDAMEMRWFLEHPFKPHCSVTNSKIY